MTTAIGLGILAFAFFPVLQQIGAITAIMIVYAFLASVLVLPSLLFLWARYVAETPLTWEDRTASTSDVHPVDD